MIVFLLLLSTICLSLAAHWEGDMSSSKDFVFMDRFAFVETGKHPQIQDQGLWSFTISKSKLDNAAKQEDVQIDLYYDSEKSWFKVYDNDDLTCWQKRSLAAPLHNTTRHSNTSHVWFDIPENIYITDSQAPHFWYIAISNCKAGENEWSVAYNMSATNPGGWWFRQFSVDQQRLLGMRFTFTWFLFLPLLVVNILFSIKLHSQGSYSLANKAISLFVLLETLDSLFQFMHLAAYAGNGSGLPFFRVLGDLVEQTSQVLITLTLLALAQGWCVTSVTLRDRKIMQGLAVGVALTYLILVIWQLGGESRESTLYYYESFPGVLALLVRIALWAYFAMSLRMTWREETNPKTRNFYVVFGGLFSLWFLILVFIVLIAAATPPVYRERTVETMYTLLNYCAAVVLTLLFAPPIADRFFDLGNAKTSLLSSDAPTGSYQAL